MRSDAHAIRTRTTIIHTHTMITRSWNSHNENAHNVNTDNNHTHAENKQNCDWVLLRYNTYTYRE